MTDEQDPDLPVMTEPAGGLPGVVDSAAGRAATIAALEAGEGPVAVDVERAQSYRYSSKAYLLQLKQAGSGTFLIDPIAFEAEGAEVAHFSELQRLIGGQEWIVHAATQDLPNLIGLGMRPTQLFDTELAGRLLGLPRVSLGAMVERYIGVRLLKEHSAVDWSTRPIPEDWLNYAALDVELLHELRDQLTIDLTLAGKQEWARQEFDWLCQWAVQPRLGHPDRWRRTSGAQQIRTPRGLALVRELWQVRDKIAHEVDRAPGRVLPDAAIAQLGALVTRHHPNVPTATDLRKIEGFRHRAARKHQSEWLEALERVAELSIEELPPVRPQGKDIPAPRNWEKVNPEAWSRWSTVRPAVVALAEQLSVPVENLIAPRALRQLLWQPKVSLTLEGVAQQLAEYDARVWQQELVAPLVVELLG